MIGKNKEALPENNHHPNCKCHWCKKIAEHNRIHFEPDFEEG